MLLAQKAHVQRDDKNPPERDSNQWSDLRKTDTEIDVLGKQGAGAEGLARIRHPHDNRSPPPDPPSVLPTMYDYLKPPTPTIANEPNNKPDIMHDSEDESEETKERRAKRSERRAKRKERRAKRRAEKREKSDEDGGIHTNANTQPGPGARASHTEL